MSKSDTLCWDCKYATGNGCPWVDKWQPVPGWNATKTNVISHNFHLKNGDLNQKSYSSYIVHSCPLFHDNTGRDKREKFKALYKIKSDTTYYKYYELGLINLNGELLVPDLKNAIKKLNRVKQTNESSL